MLMQGNIQAKNENDDEAEVSFNNNATLLRNRIEEDRPTDVETSEDEEGEIHFDETVVTPVMEVTPSKGKRRVMKNKEGEINAAKPNESVPVDPRPSTSALTNEELINQAVCRTFERMQELMRSNRDNPVRMELPSVLANAPAPANLANFRPEEIMVPTTEKGIDSHKNAKDGGGKFNKSAVPNNAKANTGARPKGGNVEYCVNNSESEVTIYRRAVQPASNQSVLEQEIEKQINNIRTTNKRDSSSSEEAAAIDTSDELMDADHLAKSPLFKDSANSFVDGGASRRQVMHGETTNIRRAPELIDPEREARERADYVVRQAEEAKAKLLEVPGNDFNFQNRNDRLPPITAEGAAANSHGNASLGLRHYEMDESYLVVGNYVEESLRLRIINGEYVDFARLLPRDRVSLEEDNRMELINKNGHTYFVPAANKGTGENQGISSFSRWEQAFRVFSNIYTNQYPHRSSELIQYNHIIYTASLSFTWENVYLYDKEFRLHIARFPQRSWSIILQQAWTMRMKDRLKFDNQSRSAEKRSNKKDICWRYNRGKCTYGAGCRFEHKCAICNKFGHGAHICRKANQRYDQDKNQQDRSGRGNDDRDRNNGGKLRHAPSLKV